MPDVTHDAPNNAPIRDLEEWRERYIQVFVMGSPMLFAAFCAITALLMEEDRPFSWPFAFMATAVGVFGLYQFLNRAYRRKMQDIVMRRVADEYGFSYHPLGAMTWDELSPHAILPPHHRRHIEDGFTGSFNDIPIAFQDMVLVDIDHDRDNQTVSKTTFQGTVIRITIGRTLDAHTVILPQGPLNRFWRTAFSAFEPVRLSAPDFENRFDVMSTQQLEAHLILDPGFMESFLNVANHIGTKRFEASFLGNEILFAIERPGPLFQIGSMLRPLRPGDIDQVRRELIAMDVLVNSLKLNPYTGLGARPIE